MKQTICDVINQVRPKKIRHSPTAKQNILSEQATIEQLCSRRRLTKTHWTPIQLTKFSKLVSMYGSDYGIIHSHFPKRQRLEIVRQYEKMQKHNQQHKNNKTDTFQRIVMELEQQDDIIPDSDIQQHK